MTVIETKGPSRIWVVMGVSGSGKTTLGRALSQRLGCSFQDADDLHPPANLEKMTAGIALTDHDRTPWLERILAWMVKACAKGEQSVLACSALKRRYRDQLRRSGCDLVFVAIDAEQSLLADRHSQRRGHFMSGNLLGSQMADYERPSTDEHAIFIAAAEPVEDQVDAILAAIDQLGQKRDSATHASDHNG